MVEQEFSLIPQKIGPKYTQGKLVVQISFGKKVFGRVNLVKEIQ
jgi:hypothetical protein